MGYLAEAESGQGVAEYTKQHEQPAHLNAFKWMLASFRRYVLISYLLLLIYNL